MIPSSYQQAIFDWAASGSGDAVVNAVAGSGKTTTLIEVSKRLHTSDALFLAFNRSIVNELKDRLGRGVACKTLNALGHAAIGRALGRQVTIAFDDDKYGKLIGDAIADIYFEAEAETKSQAWRSLTDLLSMVMANLVNPTHDAEVLDLAARYGIELPAGMTDTQTCRTIENVLRTGIAMGKRGVISYEDQIYLPVILKWRPATAQFVLVDECQDLSPAKLELALMARAPGGRMLFVGDRNQAIYGFAGASSDSVDKIIARTNAVELPLSICYRCPTSVIAEAKTIVPAIEAAPNAGPGEVTSVADDKIADLAQTGDLIVGRKNAPLVRLCIQFIRRRKPARVKGRDIGKSLVTLVKNALGKLEWADVEPALDAYLNHKIATLMLRNASESSLNEHRDRVDCVRAILEEMPCASIDDFAATVDGIFADGQSAIELSSVHRAKGLEADRVFIIEPEAMPLIWKDQAPWELQQEWNLRYVAVTRAKRALFIAGAFAQAGVVQTHAEPLPLASAPATAPSGLSATALVAVMLRNLSHYDPETLAGMIVQALDGYQAQHPGPLAAAPIAPADAAIHAQVDERHHAQPQLVEHATEQAGMPAAPIALPKAVVEPTPALATAGEHRVAAAKPVAAAPDRFSCTCVTCHAHFVSETRERVCRACGGGFVIVLAIKGKKNATPCDARCTNAHGAECNCSCGGVNHGRAWLTGFTKSMAGGIAS